MKKLFLILTLTLISSVSYGQSIEVERTPNGYKFMQGENDLSLTELLAIFESDEQTNQLANSAKINYVTAQALSLTGASFVTFSIGRALVMRENPKWNYAYIGAGLVVLSVPFRLKTVSQMKNAVDIYNANLNTSSYYFKPSFNIVSNGNGLGLLMTF